MRRVLREYWRRDWEDVFEDKVRARSFCVFVCRQLEDVLYLKLVQHPDVRTLQTGRLSNREHSSVLGPGHGVGRRLDWAGQRDSTVHEERWKWRVTTTTNVKTKTNSDTQYTSSLCGLLMSSTQRNTPKHYLPLADGPLPSYSDIPTGTVHSHLIRYLAHVDRRCSRMLTLCSGGVDVYHPVPGPEVLTS